MSIWLALLFCAFAAGLSLTSGVSFVSSVHDARCCFHTECLVSAWHISWIDVALRGVMNRWWCTELQGMAQGSVPVTPWSHLASSSREQTVSSQCLQCWASCRILPLEFLGSSRMWEATRSYRG